MACYSSYQTRARPYICGSRTCKPNSVCRIAPAGRSFLWATHYCEGSSDLPGGCDAPSRHVLPSEAFTPTQVPPYLVLLRVGFALPAALLTRRCALTEPFHPYPDVAAQAVYFLWHFPSSDPAHRSTGALPDVIRHTALRSSDFPPASSRKTPRATVRSSCQQSYYMRRRIRREGRCYRAWMPFPSRTSAKETLNQYSVGVSRV